MSASRIEVEEHEGTAAEWDDFVRKSPGGTHCHLWGWRHVMRNSLGHETHYLAARTESGELSGVLPMVRVRSWLFGDYLVSMPFLNYGGPLGTHDAIQALAERAEALATDLGCGLMELRSRGRVALDLPASHRRITVTRPLSPGEPDSVFADLPAKVRSQVRRPLKEGVTFEAGPDQLSPFYQVFARHMRDLGTPVLGKSFFESVAATFGDSVWFGCAWYRGEPVAAGCGLRFGDEIEMTWASALREHNRTAANMLLYWKFMERGCNEGLSVFNFGRCTPGGGTHRFKRQWGGEDETLWWYHRESDRGGVTPSPDRGALALAPLVWSRLPLGVANSLGPRIVRLIP